jgi:hypothetical protein
MTVVSSQNRIQSASCHPVADSSECHRSSDTAEWSAQQLREAFPWETAPRYLLRDRDTIFGRRLRPRLNDGSLSLALSLKLRGTKSESNTSTSNGSNLQADTPLCVAAG